MLGVGIAGMGHLHPEKANGASWVVYAMGAAFAFAGLQILFAPSDGTTWDAAPAVNAFFGAGVISSLAAVFCWWAFVARAGGDRVSIGPFSFLASGPWARIARAPVALAASILVAISAWAWKAFADAATRSRPWARIPARAALLLAFGWGGFRLLRPAPPPSFGSPAVAAALTGGLASSEGILPSIHGSVASSPEGAAFRGEADWLDYPLPKTLHLDGTAALQVDVRAEKRAGRRTSPVETFATAGPYVLDSEPSSDSWRVKASAGDCDLASDPLPYGKWTTVALAYDEWAGRASLFVDGKRIETVRCGSLPAERLDTLRLGTWHESYQAFTGALRGVKIFTRVGDI